MRKRGTEGCAKGASICSEIWRGNGKQGNTKGKQNQKHKQGSESAAVYIKGKGALYAPYPSTIGEKIMVERFLRDLKGEKERKEKGRRYVANKSFRGTY